jgi:lipopolysaccharide transport system ATP-binding protein
MTTVISVENLSKFYRLGQIGSGTFSNDLKLWWAKARGKPNPLLKIGETDHGNRDGEELWALRDVSFTVEQGEVLGIIGKNGAGKSTLLKILSRVTAPTSGAIKVKGRIASLLEVGTGFHPELTGRENVYLNGAILGMTRQEVTRKFDEIVDFAEVEKFIDTPVKRYSSGMYVRLAFAVAAHLDPEILVVDEVLAVGDVAFQKKCLGKMGEVAREGRTVLFVSHNMAAIQSLCTRVFWLHQGQTLKLGVTEDVVTAYLENSPGVVVSRNWRDQAAVPGNEKIRLLHAMISTPDGKSPPFSMRQEMKIEFEYLNLVHDTFLNLSVLIKDANGTVIFNTASVIDANWQGTAFQRGCYRSAFVIPGDFFNSGIYHIDLLMVEKERYVIHRELDILIFEVIDTGELRGNWMGKWPGVVHPNLFWETELREDLT